MRHVNPDRLVNGCPSNGGSTPVASITVKFYSDPELENEITTAPYGTTIYVTFTSENFTPFSNSLLQPIGPDDAIDFDYLKHQSQPEIVWEETVLNTGDTEWGVISQDSEGNTELGFALFSATGTIPPTPIDRTLAIPISEADTNASFTVVSGSEATITTIDADGLTTFAVTVNATPVSVPFDVEVGDTVELTFDAAVGAATPLLIGTYTP